MGACFFDPSTSCGRASLIVVGSREVVRTDPSRTIPPLGGRLSITSLPSPPALAQGGPSRPGRKTRYSCPLWGLVGVRTASTIWSGWIPSNMPAPRVGSGEAWSARFIARHGYRHPVLNELIKKKERGEGVFPPFSFFHFSIFPPSGAFSRGVCLQPYQEVPDFQLFRSQRLASAGRAERALSFLHVCVS